MQLEQWLKENVANANHEERRRGRKLLRFLPSALVVGIVLYAISPIELVRTWSSLSSSERLATLEGIGSFLAILIPIYLLFYFILPGKLTGKTGWQHRRLRKQEDLLVEELESVHAAAPKPPLFRDEDYQTAAQELRRFKPLKLEGVQARLEQPWFKILALSGAIDALDDRVIRLVSIKSIEQNREAGFDEE